MMRTGWVALASALLLLPSLAAEAHPRSTSTSAWEVSSDDPARARVVVGVAWSEVQRAVPAVGGLVIDAVLANPRLLAQVDRYFLDHVAFTSNGAPCGAVGSLVHVPSSDPTHFGRRFALLCGDSGSLGISVDLFRETAPSHLHIARVRVDGGASIERVLVLGNASFTLSGSPAEQARQGSSFLDYLGLGIEHIATGYDHLVFLLVLLLAGGSLRQVAGVVTGFTAAHSVTLALGVLGVVRPLPGAIEALIGLSIVVVALENFAATSGPPERRRIFVLLALGILGSVAAALFGVLAIPATALAGIGVFSLCYLGLEARSPGVASLRWLVAFVFGLIHGFGFAGILVETGLPPGRVAPALLGFNLGVEAGQLAIVLAVWPFLSRALRRPGWRPTLVQVGSAPALAAGLFWFLTRAFG